MTTPTTFTSFKLKKRHKVDLPKVIHTLTFRDHWLFDGNAEQFFELYRWLARAASEQVKTRGGGTELQYPQVLESIGCQRDYPKSKSFGREWRDDLAKRILRALLDGHGIARWRREKNIDPTQSIIVTFPTYDVALGKHIDQLFAFAAKDRRTRSAINRFHPQARKVTKVELYINDGRWAVMFSYGLDGSEWHGHDLRQNAEEPFADFVVRANAWLETHITSECKTTSHPIHHSLACATGFTGREAETKREVVGGTYLDEAIADVVFPEPIVGEVVKFKAEREVFWRSTSSWHNEVPTIEQPEDFWVLLPAAQQPSRLMVHTAHDGEVWYRAESPRGQNRNEVGVFAYGYSAVLLNETNARMARARLLLTQDMYRRGFLDMTWRIHSERRTDGILHPFASEYTAAGISPRRKKDAVQYIRDVRSVLWQSDDICPVNERTHCETGMEDGHGDEEVVVTVGPEPSRDGMVTDNDRQLAAQLALNQRQVEILCSVFGNALVPALSAVDRMGVTRAEEGIFRIFALGKAIVEHIPDPPIASPIIRAAAVAVTLQRRGVHALPYDSNGFHVRVLVTDPGRENELRFANASTKVITYDVDLPERRDIGPIAIAEEILLYESLHVLSAYGYADAIRQLESMQASGHQRTDWGLTNA